MLPLRGCVHSCLDNTGLQVVFYRLWLGPHADSSELSQAKKLTKTENPNKRGWQRSADKISWSTHYL